MPQNYLFINMDVYTYICIYILHTSIQYTCLSFNCLYIVSPYIVMSFFFCFLILEHLSYFHFSLSSSLSFPCFLPSFHFLFSFKNFLLLPFFLQAFFLYFLLCFVTPGDIEKNTLCIFFFIFLESSS